MDQTWATDILCGCDAGRGQSWGQKPVVTGPSLGARNEFKISHSVTTPDGTYSPKQAVSVILLYTIRMDGARMVLPFACGSSND